MAKNNSKITVERKFLKVFWGAVAGIFLFFILLFILIGNGLLGFMPTFELLENPKTDIATEVYSCDGVLLTSYYIEENRNPVDYKDLPPYLINALIAREDHRFVDHSGIDGMGLVRVAVKTVLMRKSGEGGGSTITQQLAKQLFRRDKTEYRWKLARKLHLTTIKFREWIIAVRLEKQYTKQEIVTMYFNMVQFGYNASGIKMAAHTYFKKNVDELKIEEAAMLVGMLQRPSYFNPVRYPERTVNRRNSVLSKMVEHGYLSQEICDSIKLLPIELDFERLDHQTGHATYFREYLRKTLTKKEPNKNNYSNMQSFREDSIQWADNPLLGWCNKNKRPDGKPYDLYTDGLKIYTTIDSRLQKHAEDAMRTHMMKKQEDFFKEKKGRKKAPFAEELSEKHIEQLMMNAVKQSERFRVMRNKGLSETEILKAFKDSCEMTVFTWKGSRDTIMTPWDSIRHHKSYLRSSMMAMDPNTGEVKVYVGGINFRHFQYDGVKTQKRQVGSTFKPILYAMAFEAHPYLTPCYEILNQQQTFKLPDTIWQPKSSGRREDLNKYVTLRWGLATSENNVTAWLVKQVNPERPVQVIDLARRMGITSYIDPVPSIVLGSPEISVAEMTAAFAVFPAGGMYTEPIFVTKINDKHGNLLQEFSTIKEEAINEDLAYLMTNMLQSVVRGGTASRLRGSTYNLTNEMAGKTGTTNNHADGWYIGFTPDLVVGVWVGGEEPSIRFESMRLGQGSEMALPIYGLFMKNAYADKRLKLSKEPFKRPENFKMEIDCNDVNLSSGEAYEEW